MRVKIRGLGCHYVHDINQCQWVSTFNSDLAQTIMAELARQAALNCSQSFFVHDDLRAVRTWVNFSVQFHKLIYKTKPKFHLLYIHNSTPSVSTQKVL